MHCKSNEIVCVSDEELLSEPRYRRLWIAIKALKISRRRWLDELSDCLRDCQASIYCANGEPYEIPVPDDIFGNGNGDIRWMSEYLKADPSGERPCIKSRKLERLRMLDLYLKIKHPSVYRHLSK
jgi:hypothetical protein